MERGARIRRRIAALGPRVRGSRVPEDLRSEIAAYALRRRDEGGRLRDIAAEIGVSPESVRRWTTAPARGRRRRAAIVPVQVRPDPEPERSVVIVTPGGLRLEGLDVERAAELVRRLG